MNSKGEMLIFSSLKSCVESMPLVAVESCDVIKS